LTYKTKKLIYRSWIKRLYLLFLKF